MRRRSPEMKLRACASPFHIAVKFSSAFAEREAVAQPTDLLLYHLSAEQELTLLHGPRAITIRYIRQSGNVAHKQHSCSLCVCYSICTIYHQWHLFFFDI